MKIASASTPASPSARPLRSMTWNHLTAPPLRRPGHGSSTLPRNWQHTTVTTEGSVDIHNFSSETTTLDAILAPSTWTRSSPSTAKDLMNQF